MASGKLTTCRSCDIRTIYEPLPDTGVIHIGFLSSKKRDAGVIHIGFLSSKKIFSLNRNLHAYRKESAWRFRPASVY